MAPSAPTSSLGVLGGSVRRRVCVIRCLPCRWAAAWDPERCRVILVHKSPRRPKELSRVKAPGERASSMGPTPTAPGTRTAEAVFSMTVPLEMEPAPDPHRNHSRVRMFQVGPWGATCDHLILSSRGWGGDRRGWRETWSLEVIILCALWMRGSECGSAVISHRAAAWSVGPLWPASTGVMTPILSYQSD